MPTERPAFKTPVTSKNLFKALYAAWRQYFNDEPKKESVILMMAHWALETGYGRSMWNFNLGNVKARVTGKHDYTFFKCNEILSKSRAERLQASAAPGTAKITKYRSNGTCIIWFYPKHPACCFRAFHDLEAGAMDHLILLHKRFNKAWPFIIVGDPRGFCHALKMQRYYTADEAQYTRSVTSIFNQYVSALSSEEPPKVPLGGVKEIPSIDIYEESSLEDVDPEDESDIYSPHSMAEHEAEKDS